MMAALIRGSVNDAAGGKHLPADGLRGCRPEGMARHADTLHIQPAVEWMPALLVPALELIERGGNVLRAENEVL